MIVSNYIYKRSSLMLFVVAMMLSLVLARPAAAYCERTFSMAHSGDYVPYQYIDGKGDLVGLDVDLIRAIMREMGCLVRIEKLPPRRAQLMLKEGSLDIMAAASITAERHTYAHFSLPYRDERIVMFVRADRFDEIGDIDLNGAVERQLTVAAGIGGWYGSEYGEFQKKAEAHKLLVLNNSTLARIRQLLSGRVDIVVADLYVGYHHAGAVDGKGKIAELPHVLNNDPVHFMLSRRTVRGEDLEMFNLAVERFIRSAEYRDLILEYRPHNLN